MNNRDKVLEWFQNNRGQVMSIWKARDVFRMNGGTFTKVVSVLREKGEPISTDWFENPDTGKRFKGYFMH